MRTSILNLRSHMIAILLLVGMATLPLATLAGILGSRHDLSGNMGSAYNHGIIYNDYGQVCVYCHTPHGSNTDNNGQLLWNKTFSAATYTLYVSPTAKLPTSQPSGASSSSALCLSCHDGTIAVDALVNMPNQPFTPSSGHRRMSGDMSADSCGGCHNPSGVDASLALPVAAAFLGTNLSNDHPVSMAYDNTINTGLNPVSAVTTAGMKLYGGKVECATCHDPHSVIYKAFLRVANTQSSMCTTCHLK